MDIENTDDLQAGKKTIDDALAEIVATAADRAAERVLSQAAIARTEVEQELAQLTESRNAMIREISLQVEASSALASKALAEHTLLELERFRAIEMQMTIAAAQMTAACAALVQIACDVKSLLATRSYTQGAWKMLTVIAVAVSAAVAMISNFLHNKWPWSH